MISRLESLGYLQREISTTDRRADVIDITPSGLSVLLGVAEVWKEGDKIMENILGSEDSKRLFVLTEKLSGALGGGPPKIEASD